MSDFIWSFDYSPQHVSMEKVIQVLNQMQADGVIEKFAIGVGIAAIHYLEPYLTDDIDFHITVVVGPNGLVSFGRIYSYLEELGYNPEREYIKIEGWLVQFVPASESCKKKQSQQADRVHLPGNTHRSSRLNISRLNFFDQAG